MIIAKNNEERGANFLKVKKEINWFNYNLIS